MDTLAVAYGVLLNRRELRDTLIDQPRMLASAERGHGRGHQLMNLTRRLPRLLSKGRGGRRNGRHQWHLAPPTTERSYRREGCGTSNPLDDYGPPQVGSPVSASSADSTVVAAGSSWAYWPWTEKEVVSACSRPISTPNA